MLQKDDAAAAQAPAWLQLAAMGLGLLILGGCLMYLLDYLALKGEKVLDDSYITYVYALNLAEGHGLRYNPTDLQPTEGGTSFSHILIAAAGIKLGIDPLTTTRLVSLLAFFGATLALARAIALIARPGFGLSLLAAAAATALAVMLPETPGHFVKGLETIGFFSLHIALASWAMIALLRAPHMSVPSIAIGAALAILLGLTRPEGVLIAGAMLGLTALLAAVKTGSLNIRAATGPVVAGVLFCAVIGAFLLWKVWYFGDALPNAYWVKSHNRIFGNGGEAFPGLSQVAYFMALRFLPLALAVVALFALAGLTPRPVLPYAALALPAMAIALLYVRAIHEVAGGFRYGFPMLAPLFVLFGIGFALVIRRYPQGALAACLMGLMGATTVGSTLTDAPLAWATKPASRAMAWIGKEPSEGPLESLALDLRDTGLGQDATVYLSAAGLIPYVSRFKAVDWIGLNNNTLSGANEMSLDEVWSYIRSTNPDVIQTVVPPASPGALSRHDDPAFNSPAVKDLLRGRVKLFYYWDREIVAEMLWREMVWIRDHASFAGCYDLRGSWTLFAYVLDRSPHAEVIAGTLSNSPRSGCDAAKTRDAYRSDPFRGDLTVALR